MGPIKTQIILGICQSDQCLCCPHLVVLSFLAKCMYICNFRGICCFVVVFLQKFQRYLFLFFFFFFIILILKAICNYRYFPKFSDGQVWANSADPDQTAPSLIRVYTVCNSLCIFWIHYSKEQPSCSTFRVITANVRVSEILGFLQ